MAFAALIDDPGEDHLLEHHELLELIKRIAFWEAIKDGNLADIKKAHELILKQYGRPPRVLDPFAGGGSIRLEALRLGREAYASDYNPVAVFIEEATWSGRKSSASRLSCPARRMKVTTIMPGNWSLASQGKRSKLTCWLGGEVGQCHPGESPC